MVCSGLKEKTENHYSAEKFMLNLQIKAPRTWKKSYFQIITVIQIISSINTFTIMSNINLLIWSLTYVFDLCHALFTKTGEIYNIKINNIKKN